MMNKQIRKLEKKTEEKSIIHKTTKNALQAIQKEFNIENMVEQEEKERESKREQQLLLEMEQEKKKSVNL